MTKNIVLELSFNFALKIILFCEELDSQRKYIISKQLLRSGTSIGSNIREAQKPHSKADFVSKLIIALKEAEETEYWLQLCQYSKNYPDPNELLDEVLSIKKILSKIVSNTRKSQ